jgi:hypothetical protein
MKEMKQLLIGALHEIRRLRRDNEVLSAQMAVVDVFAAACGLKRHDSCMAVDVAWELENKIEAMKDLETV